MKLVLHPEVEAARLARLAAASAPMRVVNCASEAEAVAEIADADGFFGKLTPAMLAAARQLRWVQSPTASLEHYIFPALAAHPLQLTNMRGPCSTTTSQTTCSVACCASRATCTSTSANSSEGNGSPMAGASRASRSAAARR